MQDTNGEDTVTVWVINVCGEVKTVSVKSKIKQNHTQSGTSAQFLPAAGVLVEVSAGKALVLTASSKNPPSLLSTAHMDPGEVWQNK